MAVFRDSGRSGTALTRRPGMRALVELVAQRGIGVVVAKAQDRLTRAVDHFHALKKFLHRNGTDLWTLEVRCTCVSHRTRIRRMPPQRTSCPDWHRFSPNKKSTRCGHAFYRISRWRFALAGAVAGCLWATGVSRMVASLSIPMMQPCSIAA